MRISDFRKKELNLLKEIKDKAFITKSRQKIYGSSIGFYMGIWSLRDRGLVVEDGVDERRQKRWILTDKGKEIIEHLLEIEKIMEG